MSAEVKDTRDNKGQQSQQHGQTGQPQVAPSGQTGQTDHVLALCKHVAGRADRGERATPLADLPPTMRTATVLAAAMIRGLLQVGRQNHTEVITRIDHVKGPDGKQVYENGRAKVRKEYEVRLENEWSWTSLKGPNRKSVGDLLAEENETAHSSIPRLHVRLTDDGMAASV